MSWKSEIWHRIKGESHTLDSITFTIPHTHLIYNKNRSNVNLNTKIYKTSYETKMSFIKFNHTKFLFIVLQFGTFLEQHVLILPARSYDDVKVLWGCLIKTWGARDLIRRLNWLMISRTFTNFNLIWDIYLDCTLYTRIKFKSLHFNVKLSGTIVFYNFTKIHSISFLQWYPHNLQKIIVELLKSYFNQ